MKKYCPKCGKKLEEGNICDCQNKKGIFQTILDFAAKPVDTVNDFVKTATRENSYLLILITSIIMSFCITDAIFSFTNPFLFPFFKYLLVTTILIIVCFIMFTLILNLLIKQSKKNVAFDNTLKIVSASSIALIYAFLITMIMNVLFNVYTLIIILIGIFVFGYLVIETLVHDNKIDNNKGLIYFILTVLITVIVITILF